jgi:hypothetical protein
VGNLMTNPEDDVFEKIILEQEHKEIQWRLVVSRFREIEYLHLRKYYLDFEGEYQPTKEGACIPFEINSLSNLFEALIQLLSKAESKDAIKTHFNELLENLYD